MKEIDLFENWLNSLNESTVIPTSTQQQQQLLQLLSKPLPVGSDATNATETLNKIFMDPQLVDDLQDLAETDPNADARPVVISKLNDYKTQPGIAAVMAKISNTNAAGEQPAGPGEEAVDATAPTPPAPEQTAPVPPVAGAAPAPAPGAPAEPAQPVAEDEYDYDASLSDILKNAGVEPCDCPAEDYITGKDPHVNEDDCGSDGDFTKSELHSILRNAGQLERMIDSSADLPEWLQAKLSQAKGMVQSAADYLENEAERGAEDEMGLGGIHDIEFMEDARRPFDEGLGGAAVGGALGSALGPLGTIAGSEVGDWAGEKIAGSDWGKKAAGWASDAAGSVTSKFGGRGAGEVAKGLTSYALAPDSDTADNTRTTSRALGAASHLPGIAGKIAKGASTVMNLSNKASALSKIATSGASAAELMNQPGAAKAAQEILSKGGEALNNPAVRDKLMQVAGKGMTAAAGAKAQPGGIKGAVAKGMTAAKGAVGAAKGAATKAATGTRPAQPVAQQPSFAQPAPPQAAPQQTMGRTAYAAAPTPSSPIDIAPSAEFVQGHSAQLAKAPRTVSTVAPGAAKPTKKMHEEISEPMAEDINTGEIGLSRMMTLAGIGELRK